MHDAETPNELQFAKQNAAVIENALTSYRANKLEPRIAWQPFDQVQTTKSSFFLLSSIRLLQLLNAFAQRSNKRSALTLDMNHISPILAGIVNSSIPLPGQESLTSSNANLVTIAKIASTAIILPTKTRPKKLLFIGSDGKQYLIDLELLIKSNSFFLQISIFTQRTRRSSFGRTNCAIFAHL